MSDVSNRPIADGRPASARYTEIGAMPPVYFVQHLIGHDERLLCMATGRTELASPAVGRILASLQPLDRIDLSTWRFDCDASLERALCRHIGEAERAGQGWRVFDAHGTLRCKRFPEDAHAVFPQGPSSLDERLHALVRGASCAHPA